MVFIPTRKRIEQEIVEDQLQGSNINLFKVSATTAH